VNERRAADCDDDFDGHLVAVQASLLAYLRSLTGDIHDALDLRQLVNLVLWRKRDCFRHGTDFKSWAFRVAFFEAKNSRRKGAGVCLIPLHDRLFESLPAGDDAQGNEHPERAMALSKCLGRVRERDMELLRHRYWSGDSLESFAARKHCSVGTLKARLHQIRAGLRQSIDAELRRAAI
jgi:RNA polymerase sigma-70 factor (ECF subfamily)